MYNPIKKMLVAVDGSQTAIKALGYALSLAEKCGAEIQIVCVVQTIGSATPTPQSVYASFIYDLEKGAETVLTEAVKIAKDLKPDLKISTKLLKGRPAEEIVRLAKEEDSDIVVLGSRGLGNAEDFFLGSVSDRVADKATCPVLIVK